MDTVIAQPLIEDDRLYDTNEVAEILHCSPSAIRNSRNTGRLLGLPAPGHIKMGTSVRYKGCTVRGYRDQFPEQLPLPGIA